MPSHKLNRVAIIGAGFSGYVAAATASSFANEVVVFSAKKEGANEQAKFRNQHCHFLLAQGFRNLASLFEKTPVSVKFEDVLKASKLEKIDAIGQFAVTVDGIKVPNPRSELASAVGNWSQFHEFARIWVSKLPNVTVRYSSQVMSVSVTETRQTLVTAKAPDSGLEAEESFDLVIECSGLNERLPSHLAQIKDRLGLMQTDVESRVHYQSQRFELECVDTPFERAYSCAAAKNDRFGCLLLFEGPKNFLFTVSDTSSDPLKLENGVEAAMQFLRHPQITALLKASKPTSKTSTYVKSSAYLRMTDSNGLPLIFFGDSRASLNPLFGEGMSMTLDMALSLYNFGIRLNASAPEIESLKILEADLNAVSRNWFRRSKSTQGTAAKPASGVASLIKKALTFAYFAFSKTLNVPALKDIWSKVHRTPKTTWKFLRNVQ